jgi:hypothetical protein
MKTSHGVEHWCENLKCRLVGSNITRKACDNARYFYAFTIVALTPVTLNGQAPSATPTVPFVKLKLKK